MQFLPRLIYLFFNLIVKVKKNSLNMNEPRWEDAFAEIYAATPKISGHIQALVTMYAYRLKLWESKRMSPKESITGWNYPTCSNTTFALPISIGGLTAGNGHTTWKTDPLNYWVMWWRTMSGWLSPIKRCWPPHLRSGAEEQGMDDRSIVWWARTPGKSSCG
jgi:hypothetical protein